MKAIKSWFKQTAAFAAFAFAAVFGLTAMAENAKVAKIGSDEFETLKAAVEAATRGQTIEMLTDATIDATIAVTNSVKIDLNGKVVTIATGTSNYPFEVNMAAADSTFEVTNGTFCATSSVGGLVQIVGGSAANIVFGSVTARGATNGAKFPGQGNNNDTALFNDKTSTRDVLTFVNCDIQTDTVILGGNQTHSAQAALNVKGGTYVGVKGFRYQGDGWSVVDGATITTTSGIALYPYSNTILTNSVVRQTSGDGNDTISIGGDDTVTNPPELLVYETRVESVSKSGIAAEHIGVVRFYSGSVKMTSTRSDSSAFRVNNTGGAIYVYDGEFIGTYYALYDDSRAAGNENVGTDAQIDVIEVEGGTFTGNLGFQHKAQMFLRGGLFNGRVTLLGDANYQHLTISGGKYALDPQTSDFNKGLNCIASGCAVMDNPDPVTGTAYPYLVSPKAVIGQTNYASLAEAIAAAAGMDPATEKVIEIQACTITETIELPATLKNVTFRGQAGGTSILKGMSIDAYSGNEYTYENIWFDGIVFDDTFLRVTGMRNGTEVNKNWKFTNNTFKNLADHGYSYLHFASLSGDEPAENFTFTGNTVNGSTFASCAALNISSVTGEILFNDNNIQNLPWRPMNIQINNHDGVADVLTVTGNKFGVNGSAPQMLTRFSDGTDNLRVRINNNIFGGDIPTGFIVGLDPLVAVDGDLTHNYYSSATTRIYYSNGYVDLNSDAAADLPHADNAYFSYYTGLTADGEIDTTTLVEVKPAVCKIDSVKYATLEAAIAAAATDGSTNTIQMLADYQAADRVVIDADKAIVLDLNGKAVKGTVATYDSDTMGYFLINNGYLMVSNAADSANGSICNVTTAFGGQLERNFGGIYNTSGATLVFQSGKVGGSGPGGSAIFNVGACVINGGTFQIGAGDRSDRNSTNYTIRNDGTMTVNGGQTVGYSRGQFSSCGTLTVNNMTIGGGKYYYNFYIWGGNVVIKGGTIVSEPYTKNCYAIGLWATPGASLTIEGGNFTQQGYGQYGKTFVMAVAEVEGVAQVKPVLKGGTYNVNPAEDSTVAIADSHEVVANETSPATWTVVKFDPAAKIVNVLKDQMVAIDAPIDSPRADVYLNMWGFWGMKGMKDGNGNECPQYVPITDNTLYRDTGVAENLDEAWVSAKYLYDNHLAPGTDCASYQTSVLFTVQDVVTEKSYKTLQEAVNAVQEGETIEVLKDNAEAITVDKTCSFTLDSNGYTLSETAPTVPSGYEFVKNGDVCTYGEKTYEILVCKTSERTENGDGTYTYTDSQGVAKTFSYFAASIKAAVTLANGQKCALYVGGSGVATGDKANPADALVVNSEVNSNVVSVTLDANAEIAVGKANECSTVDISRFHGLGFISAYGMVEIDKSARAADFTGTLGIWGAITSPSSFVSSIDGVTSYNNLGNNGATLYISGKAFTFGNGKTLATGETLKTVVDAADFTIAVESQDGGDFKNQVGAVTGTKGELAMLVAITNYSCYTSPSTPLATWNGNVTGNIDISLKDARMVRTATFVVNNSTDDHTYETDLKAVVDHSQFYQTKSGAWSKKGYLTASMWNAGSGTLTQNGNVDYTVKNLDSGSAATTMYGLYTAGTGKSIVNGNMDLKFLNNAASGFSVYAVNDAGSNGPQAELNGNLTIAVEDSTLGKIYGAVNGKIDGNFSVVVTNATANTYAVLSGTAASITGDSSITFAGNNTVKSLVDGFKTVTIAEGAVLNGTSAVAIRFTSAWVNGGTLAVDMTGATDDSYTLVDNQGTAAMDLAAYGTVTLAGSDMYSLKVVDNDLVAVKAAAQIGETKYFTLQDAVDAVQAGETIEVLADNAEAITVTRTVSFTLDSKGYTLSTTAPVIPEGYEFVRKGNVCTYRLIPNFYQDETDANLWHIRNLAGLVEFRDSVNAGTGYAGKTIRLDADIDMASIDNWTPIGISGSVKFHGSFDGNDKTISNLKINRQSSFTGLFGSVFENDPTSVIRDLTLVNPVVVGIDDYAGAVVGHMGCAVVTNCAVIGGSVTGGEQVGGIAGMLSCGSILGCTVDGTAVHATGNRAGGITGKVNVDSEYRVIGNVVRDATVTSDGVHDDICGAGALIGQIMTGGENDIWETMSNCVVNCTTVTQADDTLVPIGNFRKGSFREESITLKHILDNAWYPATTPNSFTMVNPSDTTQFVVIPNANVQSANFYADPAVEGLYHIVNLAGLVEFRDSVNAGTGYAGKTIRLDADIDMASIDNWTPIGISGSVKFHGSFDGNDKTISNLKINRQSSFTGLFGSVFENDPTSVIRDLTLVNPVVVGIDDYAGALVGHMGCAVVTNCAVIGGSVTGGEQVGGIAGMLSCGSILGCTVDGTAVHATGNRAGGITGKVNVDSEYRVIGNVVRDATVTSDGVHDDICGAGALIGQIMTGGENDTWETMSNCVVSCTTVTQADDTLVPIGNFRKGSFREESITLKHILDNAWYPATTPNSFTMVNPSDTTQFVVIPNANVVTANFYRDPFVDDLWHVANLAGLKEFRDSVNVGTSYAGKTIRIDADIDLSNDGCWTSIKAYGSTQAGLLAGAILDGAGHTITGMTIVTPDPESGYAYGGGFIDKVNGGLTVRDLAFENASVTSASGSQVGIVAGMTYGDVTMDNVDLKNCVVTGETKTGLLVGQNDEGKVTVKNCDIANSQTKANYSSALLVGLLNENSDGAEFVDNTVDADSKFVWILTSETSVKGVLINGRYYRISGENLWLTDPGETCLAEQRKSNATLTYKGTKYNLKGSKFYPEYDFAAKIGEINYLTLQAAVDAVDADETIEVLKANAETITVTRTVSFTLDSKGFAMGETAPTVPSGYTFLKNSETVCTFGLIPTAVVKVGGVTTGYADLHAALEAAKAEGAVCELLKDVTLTGKWTPVADFMGTFDGKGFTISGLDIEGEGNLGIFATVSGSGIVKNVTIANPKVTSTKTDATNIGVVAGYAYYCISNVTVTGATVATDGKYVGGIVGSNSAEIKDCKVIDSTVTGNDQVGGAVGYQWCGGVGGTTVSGGSVTARSERAGGLIGKFQFHTENDGHMWVCNNTVTGVTLSAPDMEGGLAAQIMGADGEAGCESSNYEVQNNTIDVTFTGTPTKGTNPIGILRDGQGSPFTGALAANITGNWWENGTLNADSFTYTNVGEGVAPQTIYRGVARIGANSYRTIDAAIAAANAVTDGSAQTITVLADCSVSADYQSGNMLVLTAANVTLDLNGKTLTTLGNFAFTIGGDNDKVINGTIQAGPNGEKTTGINSYAIVVASQTGGTKVTGVVFDGLTVNGGIAAGCDPDDGLTCAGGCELVIRNCTVTAGDFYAVFGQGLGNVVIESGTFVLSVPANNSVIGASQSAKITVKGGTFNDNSWLNQYDTDHVCLGEGCELLANTPSAGWWTVVQYVAEVTVGETTTKYASLSTAFANATTDGAAVKLLCDIDLAGENWTPVNFSGTFDGNGKTISNLTVTNCAMDYVGFFSEFSGEARNVTFTGADVTGAVGNGGRAGVFTCVADSKYLAPTTISNVTVVASTVRGTQKSAGLVGFIRGIGNGYYDASIDIVHCTVSNVTLLGLTDQGLVQAGGLVGNVGSGSTINILSNTVANVTIDDKAKRTGLTAPERQYACHAFMGVLVNGRLPTADYTWGVATLYGNTTDQCPASMVVRGVNYSEFIGDYANWDTPISTSKTYPTKLVVDGVEITAPAARIGERNFESLQNAVNAVQEGETVEVLKDNAETLTITNTCSFTLDSKGFAMGETAPTVPDGYEFVKNGSVCTYQKIPFAAQIVETSEKYLSLAAAVQAVENGQTIKLLRDQTVATEDRGSIQAKSGCGYTLLGNAYTITLPDTDYWYYFDRSDALVIFDNVRVVADKDAGLICLVSSKLTQGTVVDGGQVYLSGGPVFVDATSRVIDRTEDFQLNGNFTVIGDPTFAPTSVKISDANTTAQIYAKYAGIRNNRVVAFTNANVTFEEKLRSSSVTTDALLCASNSLIEIGRSVENVSEQYPLGSWCPNALPNGRGDLTLAALQRVDLDSCVVRGARNFSNAGTFTAKGTSIEFGNDFTNTGTITLDVASKVTVGTDFTGPSTSGYTGAFSNTGTINIDTTGLAEPTKIIDYAGGENLELANYGTVNVTDAVLYVEDNDLWVKPLPVAQIGETKYDTLALAIKAVEAGSKTTIKMIRNTIENVTVPSGKDIVLDLNGQIVDAGGNGSAIVNNGTLEIVDSAQTVEHTFATDATSHLWVRDEESGTTSVLGGVITRATAGAIVNNGTLTLTAGTIGGNAKDFGSAVVNAGTFTLAGGTLESNYTSQGGAIYGSTAASKTIISGGTLRNNASAQSGGAVWSQGDLTVSGGLFDGNVAKGTSVSDYTNGGGAIFFSGASASTKLTITGGTFTNSVVNGTYGAGADVYVRSNNKAQFAVSGGTFSGSIYINGSNALTTPTVTDGDFYSLEVGTGGGSTSVNTGFITGGWYSVKPAADLLYHGYRAIYDNTRRKWGIVKVTSAKIGDQEYATLADAIVAVKEGETIELLANNSETIEVNKTCAFTIEKGTNKLSGVVTSLDPLYDFVIASDKGSCAYTNLDAVCQIGTQGYSSLEKAFRLAFGGDTVQMLKGVTNKATIVVTKTITLDLNGKRVYKKYESTPEYDGEAFLLESDAANLTIEDTSVTTYKRNSSTDYNPKFIEGALITDGWGEIDGTTDAISVYAGTLRITGGNIQGYERCIWQEGGTITIENGVVFGDAGGIVTKAGSLTVTDGDVIAGDGGEGIFVNDWDRSNWYSRPQVTISGGLIGSYHDNALSVSYYYYTAKTIVTITGGKFRGGNDYAIYALPEDTECIQATGGYFSTKPFETYIDCHYGAFANKETETKDLYPWVIQSKSAVAKIGETEYWTLEDAVKVVAEGQTIEILADNHEAFDVTRTVAFSMKRNGHALTGLIKPHTNVSDNWHFVVDEAAGTCSYCANDNTTKVLTTSSEKEFATFAEAVAYANTLGGYTMIRLMRAASFDGALAITRSSVTLNLYSQTLTMGAGASLAVKGSNVYIASLDKNGNNVSGTGYIRVVDGADGTEVITVTGSDVMTESIDSTVRVEVAGTYGNIALATSKIVADDALTAKDGAVIIAKSGTYKAATSGAKVMSIAADATNAHVIVKGGSFTGAVDAGDGFVDIRAGTYANWAATEGDWGAIEIIAGTYDADPAEYVEEHYCVLTNSPSAGKYTVKCRYECCMVGEDGEVIRWTTLQDAVDRIRLGEVGAVMLCQPSSELTIPADCDLWTGSDGNQYLTVYTYIFDQELQNENGETTNVVRRYCRTFEQVTKNIEAEAKRRGTKSKGTSPSATLSSVPDKIPDGYKVIRNGNDYVVTHKIYTCQVIDATGKCVGKFETIEEAKQAIGGEDGGVKIVPPDSEEGDEDYEFEDPSLWRDDSQWDWLYPEQGWDIDPTPGEKQQRLTKDGCVVTRILNYDGTFTYTLEVYIAQIGTDHAYTTFEDAINAKTNTPEFADVPIVVPNYTRSMVAPDDWKFVQTGDAKVFHLVAKAYICAINGNDDEKYESFVDAIDAMVRHETTGELLVINYDSTTMSAPSGWKFKQEGGSWFLAEYVMNGSRRTDVSVKASGTNVKREDIARIVKDVFVAEQFETMTEVLGVQLSRLDVTNAVGTITETSGVQRVVSAAKESGDETFKATLDEATNVVVKVDVTVNPIRYAQASSAMNTGVMSFTLAPTATVTAVSETAQASTAVRVLNDMIATNQSIEVSFYTGFKPLQVVHRADDGSLVKEYKGSEVSYNATTGVTTVKIAHFSSLTAVQDEEYMAQVIDGETITNYLTLQAALDAVTEGATVSLLMNNVETVTVSKTFAFTFLSNGYTLGAAPTVASGYGFVRDGDACVYGKIVAKIGNTIFHTLQAAINAVQNGDTITLSANSTEALTIDKTCSFTVAPNGYSFDETPTIAQEGYLFVANGDVYDYGPITVMIVSADAATTNLYLTLKTAVGEVANNETIFLLANNGEVVTTAISATRFAFDANGYELLTGGSVQPAAGYTFVSTGDETCLYLAASRVHALTFAFRAGEPALEGSPTAPEAMTIYDDKSWQLPEMTSDYRTDDYTFVGWTDADETYVTREISPGMVTASAITLYAKFSAIVKPSGGGTVEVTAKKDDAEKTSIVVTQEWVDNNVTPTDPKTGATASDINTELEKTDANGLKKWQNYVLGLENETNTLGQVTAVVSSDAAQNDDANKIPVVPAVNPKADTGFTVKYALQDVTNPQDPQTVVEATTIDGLQIDLSTIEKSAKFKVNVVLTADGATTGESIDATNTIGVLKTSASAQQSLLSVPWAGLDGKRITVANVIKTANLTAGDVIYVYDEDVKTYREWKLLADKTWSAITKKVKGKTVTGIPAEDYELQRGAAIWIERDDTSTPIWFYGQDVEDEASAGELKAESVIASSDEGEASWNLVASPSENDFDLTVSGNKVSAIAAEGDIIQIPTATTPVNYKFINGVWCYQTVQKIGKSGKISKIVWVPVTSDMAIPAGQGFWYLNSGEGKKIEW